MNNDKITLHGPGGIKRELNATSIKENRESMEMVGGCVEFQVPISGSVTCRYCGEKGLALVEGLNIYEFVKQSKEYVDARLRYEEVE